MNIKSKLLCLSSAAILTMTLGITSFAAVSPFTDISNVSAKDKIISLQERGYVNGIGGGLFAPNDNVTGAQGVQFIVNAFNLNLDFIRFIKEPKATDYFQKANNDAWYANALIIASVNSMDLPNDLDPGQEWTREEFTYYLVKTMEKHGNLPMINLVPVKISDEDQMLIDYSGAIQRALSYKVVKLDSEGNFNPKGKITRAEAAEEVYNSLEYIKTHPAPVVK